MKPCFISVLLTNLLLAPANAHVDATQTWANSRELMNNTAAPIPDVVIIDGTMTSLMPEEYTEEYDYYEYMDFPGWFRTTCESRVVDVYGSNYE